MERYLCLSPSGGLDFLGELQHFHSDGVNQLVHMIAFPFLLFGLIIGPLVFLSPVTWIPYAIVLGYFGINYYFFDGLVGSLVLFGLYKEIGLAYWLCDTLSWWQFLLLIVVCAKGGEYLTEEVGHDWFQKRRARPDVRGVIAVPFFLTLTVLWRLGYTRFPKKMVDAAELKYVERSKK
eukprot:CAMPEP_0168542582 /NCGR_PEP_ID=MMETSP0413-20121227/1421_1 /TAXON_ID=136452 /ORGANISM="Filamoeba nolandi, Strain NC-AS-23-1" /LENGTH=177 /DNA_ID=CAMNT_0008572461 /DNA_START=59 /DNA_END=592 /DNA_ORIENTATION=+